MVQLSFRISRLALATVAAPRTDANAFRLMTWTLIPSCDAALAGQRQLAGNHNPKRKRGKELGRIPRTRVG